MRSFHRRTFSYGKLRTEPIRLSVLKLDGSSFEVYVRRSGTVGDLKLAIETAFINVPKNISWSHVWGNFCLSYGGQKLVTDTDSIGRYGMKDGDKVRFKNHVAGNAVLSNGNSRKFKQKNSERLVLRDGEKETRRIEESPDHHDPWDDLRKGSFLSYKDDDDTDIEDSPEDKRSRVSNVRSCCFPLSSKELYELHNHSRSYYSLRDTWRDD